MLRRSLGSNLRRRASSFIGHGNLDRRSPAPHTSAADRPEGLSHIAIDARKMHPAESMSCDEFPESVNAARMSACATVFVAGAARRSSKGTLLTMPSTRLEKRY